MRKNAMNFKTGKVNELYTLHGDFVLPVGAVEHTDNGFKYSGDGYTVSTVIEKHVSGVCKRKDVITNVSDKDIDIRAALSKFSFNGGEYEVYTQYSEWCHEGIGAWHKLVTEVGVGNDDIRTNVGSAPFIAIYNVQNGRGMAFHILAESTWQMKAKRFFSSQGNVKHVFVEAGINEKGFDYTLAPGQSLEMPAVLYYEFKNKTDMDAYKLHRYYNSVKPARAMPIVYDTWLSNFDDISYDLLMEQLEEAKALGIEYFVIDAGWFFKPRAWWNSVGDWEEETEDSMRGRMKEFADKVREYGLKFGLWFEIERAGVESKTFQNYPEYYKKENGYAFVDFSNPEAVEYIYGKLDANIKKYGIEYIKFDYNAELTYDSSNHSFIEYFKGYKGFLDRIAREHSEIYLENCASGGLRMSLASLDGFDSFWISDNHSLYTQLEIFKNTLIRMPSRALETWLTVASVENFTPTYDGKPCEKMISSGNADWSYVEFVEESFVKAVMFGGPLGISCNLTRLSASAKEMLREKYAEFKRDRAFWAESECHILCDTETVLVLQFNDAEYKNVKIYSFVDNPMQSEITVYPVLDANGIYALGDKDYSASEIDENGVSLKVEWQRRRTGNSVELKKI